MTVAPNTTIAPSTTVAPNAAIAPNATIAPDAIDQSTLIGRCGAGLAAVGAAHFVAPRAFAPLTRRLFAADTTAWTYRNGAAETAIGLLLIRRGTGRRIGFVGLGAYLAHLGLRALR